MDSGVLGATQGLCAGHLPHITPKSHCVLTQIHTRAHSKMHTHTPIQTCAPRHTQTQISTLARSPTSTPVRTLRVCPSCTAEALGS
jgi:hypothetical protein